ncbi:UBAP1-MVB12-associated (UMA)-domain containing protein 1 isoform X1 [Astatotilapia calliptera]|uniref:UBAP1-MVB12-associated (UMA) domain containing 1 n=2 Tax=Haplochromini TaxID=319058 RepID=A0A3Q2VXR6_HAPBU|nr:UBAP1-MVB12-associated (UMA)-domain containing protein 1 isoform X1 [Maylandia zebra]XP_012777245.2 UBAP1-MVB12-associated (UMA)-domain containing protein 1 isoform X1 [Maylandia zebra]XP_014184607.1 UBAP1-MVB12-associated (UMA)-domain containing protein 1 [Haplochromis burtoni]XP_014184608.1 UBAP1-MVB12-associated (UMA)-domain containing protein 1 [Haplochromis burtoni]XP_026012379.1 UBAP1-MVB12-associated (UMA)-domain containing protein 1 isoform X1 [Astatotilapia calliptera]XP_026012380.
MWSLFGLRKDSKKSTPDKEVDGGFVIVAETVEEQRQKLQTMNVTQPSTNVIVQASKSSCSTPDPQYDTKFPATSHNTGTTMRPRAVEAHSTLPDLLGDVPFTLAPHVLAMQAGFPLIPDILLSRDINYNLASFQYDFTLENSILHNA